eukprot:552594_1
MFFADVHSTQIHCISLKSCQESRMFFNKISQYNNSNTFVSCYARDSCTSLAVYADGKYTRLNMYEYSNGVALNNGWGYFESLGTLTCGFDQKYIQWDALYSNDVAAVKYHNQTFLDLILSEWETPPENRIWPCKDVTIACNRNLTSGLNNIFGDGSGSNDCMMEMYIKDVDRTAYPYPACVYVWLQEIIELQCKRDGFFTCDSDPTYEPTPSPTNYPTYTPTNTPSISPTQPPSLAPSLSPSITPTQPPSITPSISPTITPSIAPSLSPSLTPTVAP